MPDTKGTKRVHRKKRSSKSKKSDKKVSKYIRKYVKSQIHKNIENKTNNIEFANEFGSYLENNSLSVRPLMPYTSLFPGPTQGVASNNRIGNEIRPRKLMLRYTLRPRPYDATVNPSPVPCYVQFWILSLRQASGVLPQAIDFTQMFNNGSSVLSPQGDLSDLVAPFNKDFFHLYKTWTHKIGFATNSGTGANASWQQYANNDFKLSVVKKLDLTKYMPKVVKFNDATQSVMGRNLFLCYQAVAANGSALTSAIRTVAIDGWIDFTFEDA